MASLHISTIPTRLPHLVSPHHNTADSDDETAVKSPTGSQVGEMGYISDTEPNDEGTDEEIGEDGGDGGGALVSAWSDDSSDDEDGEEGEDEDEENGEGGGAGDRVREAEGQGDQASEGTENEEEENDIPAVYGGDDEISSEKDADETSEAEDDEEAAGTAVEGNVSPSPIETDAPAGTDIDAEEGDDREVQNIPA